mmetsp:Transcript_18466/g.39507  ORF Transcript_18466/g.39507 Transcript_18466/m.39507 type:complete len:129 (-) Transcript_18466:1333-1719(-)
MQVNNNSRQECEEGIKSGQVRTDQARPTKIKTKIANNKDKPSNHVSGMPNLRPPSSTRAMHGRQQARHSWVAEARFASQRQMVASVNRMFCSLCVFTHTSFLMAGSQQVLCQLVPHIEEGVDDIVNVH